MLVLKYPLSKDMVDWHKRLYPSIMTDIVSTSGYRLIGLAEDTFDVYVAFTNEAQDNLWIEKTNKLLGTSGMYAKSFVQIDNDEEFNRAHQFFVKKGILDGKKDTRKNM